MCTNKCIKKSTKVNYRILKTKGDPIIFCEQFQNSVVCKVYCLAKRKYKGIRLGKYSIDFHTHIQQADRTLEQMAKMGHLYVDSLFSPMSPS